MLCYNEQFCNEFSELSQEFYEEKKKNPDAGWILYELLLEQHEANGVGDLIKVDRFLKIAYATLSWWMKAAKGKNAIVDFKAFKELIQKIRSRLVN